MGCRRGAIAIPGIIPGLAYGKVHVVCDTFWIALQGQSTVSAPVFAVTKTAILHDTCNTAVNTNKMVNHNGVRKNDKKEPTAAERGR